MSRAATILPHVIVALYVTFINILPNMSAHVRMGTLPALRAASLIALAACAALLFPARRREGLSPVGTAYLIFFAANAVAYWALPDSAGRLVSTNPTALLYGALCAVAALPALAGRYFTEYFARRTTTPAVWRTDLFRTINRNMTFVWAAIFAAATFIALVPDLIHMSARPVRLIIQMGLPLLLMLGFGRSFNRRYPAYYQARAGIGPATVAGAYNNANRKEKTMTDRFRVVAINGSPHGAIGNTGLMVEMLRAPLADADVELEQIFLADKKIQYCVGCAVCIEKGRCWRQDDHAGLMEKVLAADGVILASPVYFTNVTGQMKTFIDRSLSYGHKPRATWKPGLALSVSAGMAETQTAEYLAGLLRVYGAFPIGRLTAIAVSPGAFLGKDLVEARAKDLASDLARAIREKRRYPATDRDVYYYLFIGDLVKRAKDFMAADYEHWQKSGLFEGFERYVGQTYAKARQDPEMRKTWIRGLISAEVAKGKAPSAKAAEAAPAPPSAGTCRELLQTMPRAFKKEAASGLRAVYQFEITGDEDFTAHLEIADGSCTFHEGPHGKPDVVIKSPADVWLAISRGKLNGQTALMTGRYTAEGDLGLLMRLKSLFGA